MFERIEFQGKLWEVKSKVDGSRIDDPSTLKESYGCDMVIKNSQLLDFFSDTEKNKHYGFSLPVILIDEGLHLFSSSKFHHGETGEKEWKAYTRSLQSAHLGRMLPGSLPLALAMMGDRTSWDRKEVIEGDRWGSAV